MEWTSGRQDKLVGRSEKVCARSKVTKLPSVPPVL